MKRVDSTKDCFNLIENEEICYEEQELLCHLEPQYPTNSQMTLDFFGSDFKNMAALKKIEKKYHACLVVNVRLNICISVSCNILVGAYSPMCYIRWKGPENQHQILFCTVFHGILTTCNYPVQPIIVLSFI